MHAGVQLLWKIYSAICDNIWIACGLHNSFRNSNGMLQEKSAKIKNDEKD